MRVNLLIEYLPSDEEDGYGEIQSLLTQTLEKLIMRKIIKFNLDSFFILEDIYFNYEFTCNLFITLDEERDELRSCRIDNRKRYLFVAEIWRDAEKRCNWY